MDVAQADAYVIVNIQAIIAAAVGDFLDGL
jgi:hypothetical protein